MVPGGFRATFGGIIIKLFLRAFFFCFFLFFFIFFTFFLNRLLSRGGIVEEDGRRWKKMEEDGRRWTKKKKSKKSRKKGRTIFCLESVWDASGTFFEVQIAQKK